MKPILEIKDISKKFRIHHEQQVYHSIRDNITCLFKKKAKGSDEDFWALKNVSFTVERGESVGIIGRNGAGKSTLLKILSKITPPSAGKIICRGRTASLLEVGTGFHGELSGRENIFLNGSILGMKKKEIESKFDEIIDFSGVEKFIDTPLKHYSSGMQLRLAFSVAAFLEPEILIIDEVLAVGDMEFQKKCISKMDDITHNGGKTILIVSHNMGVLKKLCNKALLFNKGRMDEQGAVENVISKYVQHHSHEPEISKKGNRDVQVKNLTLRNSDGKAAGSFFTFEKIGVEIECAADRDYANLSFALGFNDINNLRIITLWTKLINADFDVKKGMFSLFISISELRLVPGEYSLVTYIGSNGQQIENIDNYKRITVGFKDGRGYVYEPTTSQSLYMEDFKVALLQGKE
jgi:lipopolysaccharide transport system ATP-binding protein